VVKLFFKKFLNIYVNLIINRYLLIKNLLIYLMTQNEKEMTEEEYNSLLEKDIKSE